MKKVLSNKSKKLGNEKSYTKEFFDDLYARIGIEDRFNKRLLEITVILAAHAYITNYSKYCSEIPSHEVQKELEKTIKYIDKATISLVEISRFSDYGEDIIDNLYDIILEKYPSLHGILKDLKSKDPFFDIVSPPSALPLLESMAEAIYRTLKNYKSKKTTPKSTALYDWIMILSAKLEPIIGYKLEQSHYYKEGKKGEYISKKKMSDSELLLFIIAPLDPNVTITQIETIIKETRQERHDTPWDDYFPWD